MSTILVTGGAGFIGSHVVEALAARGDYVRVLDNFSTGKRDNLSEFGGHVEVIEGDMRDALQVSAAARGVAGIVHLAALTGVQLSIANPRETHEVNLTGTLNVLLAAVEAGVRRVVLASSAAVYGDPALVPTPESAPFAPLSPYGATKAAMEQYGAAFAATQGLGVVALRYFNVYGARQRADSTYAAVIPAFLARLRAGQAPIIYGDGEQSRDFVHVWDVARATLAALDAPDGATGAFNIGSGRGVTLLEVSHALGFTGRAEFRDGKAGEIRHSCADVTRARQVLGWEATMPLRAGVAALLNDEG